MAWNGSGVFSRTNGTNTGATTWADDAAAAVKITTARHDTHDEDLATGLNACLTQNNESKPTADFTPNVTATYDIGSTSLKWVDGHFSGALNTATLAASGNTTIGGTLVVTSTSGVTLVGVTGAAIFGGDGTGQHVAIDSNEVASKSDATTAGDLTLQRYGGGLYVGNTTPVTTFDIKATTMALTGNLTVSGSVGTEGTWTPAFSFGGGTTGITYSLQAGTYTKIGREITAYFNIGLTSNGSSTGDWLLTGLPGTVSNVSALAGGGGSINYWANLGASLVNMGAVTVINSTTALLVGASAAAATLTDLQETATGNTTIIRGYVKYHT